MERITDLLEHDGVAACPTDGRYVLCCSLQRPRAIARLQSLCGKKMDDTSVIFADIASAAHYCRIDNAAFRLLKRNLPGPFTFIVPASTRMPDKVPTRQQNVGMRIPDCEALRALVTALGSPLLAATLNIDDGDDEEYAVDPSLISERYGNRIDVVVDGGVGRNVPTTLVDLTDGEPVILREGGGILQI